MIITIIWFSDRKSKSVDNFFQQPDLGLRWDSIPSVDNPDKANPGPGADLSNSHSGFNYEIQSAFSAACKLVTGLAASGYQTQYQTGTKLMQGSFIHTRHNLHH